eukprot:scaffold20662_cov66-Phaeocystis_antarctica.AAC.3
MTSPAAHGLHVQRACHVCHMGLLWLYLLTVAVLTMACLPLVPLELPHAVDSPRLGVVADAWAHGAATCMAWWGYSFPVHRAAACMGRGVAASQCTGLQRHRRRGAHRRASVRRRRPARGSLPSRSRPARH